MSMHSGGELSLCTFWFALSPYSQQDLLPIVTRAWLGLQGSMTKPRVAALGLRRFIKLAATLLL